jgi:glutathione S-transferase
MMGFMLPLTGMVTLASLLLYFVVTMNVGRARIRFNVIAPKTDGPEEFQRYFRVQMNTLEQIVLFLPLLWLAAITIHDGLAAAIGLFWILGRFVYARNYYLDPAKRGPGFMVAMAATAALFVVSFLGIVSALWRSMT